MGVAGDRLSAFAEPAPRDGREALLGRLYGLCLLACGGLGLWLLTVEAAPAIRGPRPEPHRITFAVPVPPRPALAESAPRPEPQALAPAIAASAAAAPPATEPAPPIPAAAVDGTAPADAAPRRVYGVRRVLARGLGSAGTAAAGLVTKHGNTLDGVADTLTATPADLAGELASLGTVERAPEPLARVKPRYSEAMIAARASGTVVARLLIDADGSVRAVEVREDFGLDSRERAIEAFRQFRFRPALRDGEPVAVWIVHRIRFEFQE